MSLERILESLPDYAKDLRLNWSSLVTQSSDLTDTQKWGTLIASAFVVRNPRLLDAVVEEAGKHVASNVVTAAKGAAAIMGMNNIYYRFHHLTSNEKYATMPARLRMNVLRNHGADQLDFELWSLAASAINGCDKCVGAHEKVLLEKGITEEVILQAVRLASITHAIASVLDAEHAAAASA
jgi:alkyl hydroperoxide reductase subunit D